MAVGDAYVFPGFLTPVLTLLFFQSHRQLFSHASAEVRGENTPERKVASTWDRTHNHQVMSPTRSPLSHPGGYFNKRLSIFPGELHGSVSIAQDLITGGLWSDPRLSEDWWQSLQQDSFHSYRYPLFRQWLYGKAARGLERILCRELVKRTLGKHG